MRPTETAPRLQRFARWLELRTFAKWVCVSAVIGVAAGLAAVVFRWLIHLVSTHVFHAATGVEHEGVAAVEGRALLLPFVLALGGLVVGWLVKRFGPEMEGHGTDAVIRVYHRFKGAMRAHIAPMKGLASAVTIGTGGSAGQEGPVAQVGAGVGSTIAQRLQMSDRDRRIFLTAGGSAGVGAMFCSPLGGALFMPEVLYREPEFEGEAIIPCIVASCVAYATFTTVSGEHRAVHIAPERLASLEFGRPQELLVYLVLGVLCAVVGYLFTRVFFGTHVLFRKARALPAVARPAVGGFLVGLLALALGPVAGDHGVLFGGYRLMEGAIAGEMAVTTLLLLVVAKIVAMSLTIESGGSGGIFAPSLAIGALLGAAVGQTAAGWFPALGIEPASVALVGMGGFFAGVAKVPIASVVMVSEITGSYTLLAPLMLVAVTHMLLSTPWTAYRSQVRRPLDSPAHLGDYVVDVLQSVRVADVLGDDSKPRLIHEEVTLRAAKRIVADSHESHFPVVDDDERLVGIFSLTDLRRVFLEEAVEDVVIVADFMREQVATVRLGDSLHDVERLFTRRAVSALPVVADDDPRRVVAMLRRNDVGRAYGQRLRALKEEESAAG